MTPEQHQEAGVLLQAHNSLRYQISRNDHRRIRLYAEEDEQRTSEVSLPPKIGRQIMLVTLALVEEGLRSLGVEPTEDFKTECFESGCDGRVPIK